MLLNGAFHFQGSRIGNIRGRFAGAKLYFTILSFITKWLCGMEHFLSVCSGSLRVVQHALVKKRMIFSKQIEKCIMHLTAFFAKM